MNKTCLTAGVIMAAITALHVIGGGPDVHVRMLNEADTAEIGLYVSVFWHFVTAALALMAGGLIWAALDLRNRAAVAAFAGLLSLAIALLFFGYGAVRLGEVWTAAQWVLFLPVCALVLVSLLRQNRPAPTA